MQRTKALALMRFVGVTTVEQSLSGLASASAMATQAVLDTSVMSTTGGAGGGSFGPTLVGVVTGPGCTNVTGTVIVAITPGENGPAPATVSALPAKTGVMVLVCP